MTFIYDSYHSYTSAIHRVFLEKQTISKCIYRVFYKSLTKFQILNFSNNNNYESETSSMFRHVYRKTTKLCTKKLQIVTFFGNRGRCIVAISNYDDFQTKKQQQ